MRYSQTGFPWTTGPGAYKIPGFADIPVEFYVHLLRSAPNEKAVFSSKVCSRLQYTPFNLNFNRPRRYMDYFFLSLTWCFINYSKRDHIPAPLVTLVLYCLTNIVHVLCLGRWRASFVPGLFSILRHQRCNHVRQVRFCTLSTLQASMHAFTSVAQCCNFIVHIIIDNIETCHSRPHAFGCLYSRTCVNDRSCGFNFEIEVL